MRARSATELSMSKFAIYLVSGFTRDHHSRLDILCRRESSNLEPVYSFSSHRFFYKVITIAVHGVLEVPSQSNRDPCEYLVLVIY